MTEGDRSLIRVSVGGLVRDQRENPVVLLKGTDTDEVLPIWIGQAEALAIDLQLRGETFERPLNHGLYKTAVESLGAESDPRGGDGSQGQHVLRENLVPADVFAIDATPSDSIALAIRTHSPIFVARSVFESHKHALKSRGAARRRGRQTPEIPAGSGPGRVLTRYPVGAGAAVRTGSSLRPRPSVHDAEADLETGSRASTMVSLPRSGA